MLVIDRQFDRHSTGSSQVLKTSFEVANPRLGRRTWFSGQIDPDPKHLVFIREFRPARK